MDRSKIKKIIYIALIIRLILLFITASHPDITNHLDWGQKLWQYGPKIFYEQIFWSVSWPNQPPASILLFGLIYKIYSLIFSFFSTINQSIPLFPSKIIPILEANLYIWLTKIPFILSDILIGFFIYKIVKILKNSKTAMVGMTIWLFNPAIIYNSTIWGQTDSLINLFIIISIYFFIQKKYFGWLFFYLFSLYFKLSLLIYLPIYFVISLSLIKQNKNIFIDISKAFVLWLILLFIHNLPFKMDGKNFYQWIIYIYKTKVFDRQGDMLTGNAFNLWTIVYSINLSIKKDQLLYFFKTSTLSYLLVSICYLFSVINAYKTKKIISSLFLVSFFIFLFFTNIHERYLYPIFPLMSIITVINPKIISFKKYGLISLIHLLNLYNLWFYPNIDILKNILIFDNFLVPRILSFVLIYLYFDIFYKIMSNKYESQI